MEENKLDNPVWYSLSEMHQHFAVGNSNIKFYHPDYCPFGGFNKNEMLAAPISEYAGLTGNFFIVGQKPGVPANLILRYELVCDQMIMSQRIELEYNENIIKLTGEHTDQLFNLVNMVQPGYFKAKTSSLGDYFGIFKNNELVAVTGERMKMNRYNEISAVVTHPGHSGRGYAKQLVAHTVNHIFSQNKIPYLHVSETNSAAVNLYKKLGFTTRRKISFWNIIS